jgi:TRAP-type C4-dicarboxylate transport system permease small subunit
VIYVEQALPGSACLASGNATGVRSMKHLKRIGRGIVDVIEVYLPIGVFILMFVAFLINIFFRYVLKNPQNWTHEFSVNSFVIVGLLGACAAYRKEDHVIFDLLYARLKPRGQAVMRMLSYAIVIVLFLIALPQTVISIWKNPAVTSIMKIPDRFLYMVFPVLLLSTVCRMAYRLVLDIRAFRNGTYVQTYNTESRDELI